VVFFVVIAIFGLIATSAVAVIAGTCPWTARRTAS